jgi:hypothetical protein
MISFVHGIYLLDAFEAPTTVNHPSRLNAAIWIAR